MPALAQHEMDPIIATGMAMSNGHGVAIIKTARKRSESPGNEKGEIQKRINHIDGVKIKVMIRKN
jgi:hypothetical protein